MLSKKSALSLVNRYCKAAEIELPDEKKLKVAKYLQIQSKHSETGQKTLIPEDDAVMKALKQI